MGARTSPTSHDVARLAGVDRSTVSIVLNDPQTRRITAATKQRVLDAATQLGYAPNAAASQLRAGSSKSILIPLASVPFDPVSDAFVRGVVEGADQHGRQVLIHGSRSDSGASGAREWAQLRPEVLIAGADRLPKEAVEILLTAGVKAVVRLGAPNGGGAHGVDYRMGEAGRLAAERLVASRADELFVLTRADRHVAQERSLVEAFRGAAAPRPVRVIAVDENGLGPDDWMRSLEGGDHRVGVFVLDERLACPVRVATVERGLGARVALVALGALPSGDAPGRAYSRVGFDPATLGRRLVAAAVDVAAGRAARMPHPEHRLVPGTDASGADVDVADVGEAALGEAVDAEAVDVQAAPPQERAEGARRAGRHARTPRPTRRTGAGTRAAVRAEPVATMDGTAEHGAQASDFDSVAERIQKRRKARRPSTGADDQA